MFLDEGRLNSRRERYNNKKKYSIKLPAAIAVVSFDFDDNLAFLIRSAACFGITDVFVIGKVPDRSLLKSKSGSLYDYVRLKSFSNISEFSTFSKENQYKIVAAELCSTAISLYEYSFSFDSKTILFIGHEKSGVPGELVVNNDTVFIPMSGPGYCLNASQAGTALMSEYCRQYFKK
jgi:tRNA G18 (ribose-2'-O)-methylase SpoU